jgi:hypothetical protein
MDDSFRNQLGEPISGVEVEHSITGCGLVSMPGDKLGEKTKRQPVRAAVGIRGVPVLESEGRTEGYLEVIMRSVIEVDFVARLKTQSDRTPETFDTAARVHGEASVPSLNATQGSYESRRRVLI